ncbi:MAG: hypothetical protein AABM67_04590 [Acidobacteriota bacterium]
MKSCPTCKRTYADDTLTFCLADGALLSAPYDPHATQVLPTPPPTTIAFSSAPARPQGYSTAQDSKPKDLRWLYVVAAGFLFLIFGLGITILLVQKANTGQGSASTGFSNVATPTSSSGTNAAARTTASPGSGTPIQQRSPADARVPGSDPFVGTWTEYWPGIPQNATHVITKRDRTEKGQQYASDYEIQGSSPLTQRYVITNVRLEEDVLKFSEGTATFTVEYEVRKKDSDVLAVRAKGRSGWRDDIFWRRAQ